MKILNCILLTFAFAVLLTGCCGVIPENNTLNTTITPAKDLSGTWSGPASFQETVDGARCTITGTFTLNLQQNGNDVSGDFDLSRISIHQQTLPSSSSVPGFCAGPVNNELPGSVTGTVSSSSISLDQSGQPQFSGSFTTDIMSLTLKKCLVNDEPCTVSNGAQWKISLTRK